MPSGGASARHLWFGPGQLTVKYYCLCYETHRMLLPNKYSNKICFCFVLYTREFEFEVACNIDSPYMVPQGFFFIFLSERGSHGFVIPIRRFPYR